MTGGAQDLSAAALLSGLPWLGLFLRRLLRFVLMAATVATVAFALTKASPIDPVEAYLGPAAARVGPEQQALIAARWGLDQPPLVQFLAWGRQILAGDLGWSVIYNQPVAMVLAERARASFALMALAWILSGLLGFALGLLAGACERSLLDRAIRFYAYGLAATPTFWLAILLLLVFSVSLSWTPICCASPPGVLDGDVTLLGRLHHLLLPTITLTVLGVAPIALHTRAKMIEIMHADFAIYARAQGASLRDIVLRHGVRNAMLPAVTIQFASLGELFGGSILAEQVFSYPGLGKATIEAGIRGDVPLLLAVTMLTTLCVSFGNMVADILYRVVDPRVRMAEFGR